jgi:hypothetical protein
LETHMKKKIIVKGTKKDQAPMPCRPLYAG